uniref:Ubiquitin-conjugating enzyme E2 W n=1 Tax=Tetraselmis sp. GSL018 TaxID=582737 RepID=A0A061S1M2_9CHLO|mmetsp:Transcript_18052/g.43238  ORF Transcript_18052/g.43238 Transcript_18052/m.43238 type:complete len:162 (+) Transcript_18052:64-549(+)
MGRKLSDTALRRIQKELSQWLQNDSNQHGFLLEKFEPLSTWTILMKGPEGDQKLYEDEFFRLQVKFPTMYPIEPPEVTFLPDPPVHPHIYSNGHICLDILYDCRGGGWTPAFTVDKICLSLYSMLASNTEKRRPPDDQSYVSRVNGRSPKQTRWAFHDDRC